MFSTYGAARYFEKGEKTCKISKKAVLGLTIFANIGLLVFVKFYGYSVSVFEKIFKVDVESISVIVPLGTIFQLSCRDQFRDMTN